MKTWLIGLFALALALPACDSDETTTQITIDFYAYEPQPGEGQSSGLQGNGLADLLEVQLVDQEDPMGLAVRDGGNRSRVVDLDLNSRTGSIGALPIGVRYRMHVRGFQASDQAFTPHLYGGSVEFDVQSGDDFAVSMQVGASDCVTLNQSSRVTGRAGGTDDLAQPRAGATTTVLPDGRVVTIGGAVLSADGGLQTVHDTIEYYDPRSNQFFTLEHRLDVPRVWHTATHLSGGEILVVGGVTGGVDGTWQMATSALIINIDGGPESVRTVSMPLPTAEARMRHQAVRLDADGSVLLVGGMGADGTLLSTTWRYFPPDGVNAAEGQFVRQGDLGEPRAFHSLSTLPRQLELAIAAGGLGDRGPLKTIEVFSIRPEQTGCNGNVQTPSQRVGCFINATGVQLQHARWGHRAVKVEDGQTTVFVGGYASADREQLTREIERLYADLRIESGGMVGALSYGRGEPSVTALHDNSLLVLGGRRGNTPVSVGTRLVPRYVAGADGTPNFQGYVVSELREHCDLSEPRFGHTAVMQPRRGVVLITGGVLGQPGNLAASRRAELYFPRVDNVKDLYR